MKPEILLFNLPSTLRRALLVVGDALAVLVAIWAGFALRLGEWWPDWLQDVAWLFPLAVLVQIPTFATVGLYRPILRYADESLLYTIVLGVSAGILLLMAVWVFLREGLVPRSSWLIAWLVLGFFLVCDLFGCLADFFNFHRPDFQLQECPLSAKP